MDGHYTFLNIIQETNTGFTEIELTSMNYILSDINTRIGMLKWTLPLRALGSESNLTGLMAYGHVQACWEIGKHKVSLSVMHWAHYLNF